jgi:hypothetical protein
MLSAGVHKTLRVLLFSLRENSLGLRAGPMDAGCARGAEKEIKT